MPALLSLNSLDLTCILLVLVTIALHAHSLQDALTYDDRFAILDNDDVTSKHNSWSWKALCRMLQNDFWGAPMSSSSSHKSYRPLTVLLLRILYQLGHDSAHTSAIPFRVTSIALHAINVNLVRCVAQNITQISSISLITAVIFATHAVHVDATSGGVGIAELSASALALSAAAIGGGEEASMLATNLACALGLAAALCKETGAMVLLVLAITRILRRRNVEHAVKFITCFAAYCALRVWLGGTSGQLVSIHRLVENPLAFVGDGGDFNSSDRSAPYAHLRDPPICGVPCLWMERAANIAILHGRYLALLFFPWQLSADHSFACHAIVRLHDLGNPKKLVEPAFALVLALVGYVSAIVALARVFLRTAFSRHARAVAEAVLWFAIPFLPSSNILFYVGTYIAERLLYLPSFGYALLVGIGVHRIAFAVTAKRPERRRLVVVCLTLPVVLSMASKLLRHQSAWENDDALFREAGLVCPNSAKTRLNLGILSRRLGDMSSALRHFRTASSIAGPSYCEATYWQGVVRFDEAAAKSDVKLLGNALRVLHEAIACRWSTKDAVSALNTAYVSLADAIPAMAQHVHRGWAVALATACSMCETEGAGCINIDLPSSALPLHVPMRLQSCRYILQANDAPRSPAESKPQDYGYTLFSLASATEACMNATALHISLPNVRQFSTPLLAALLDGRNGRISYMSSTCDVLRDALSAAILFSDAQVPASKRRKLDGTFGAVSLGASEVHFDVVRLALTEYLTCTYALEDDGASPWLSLSTALARTSSTRDKQKNRRADRQHIRIVHALQAANAYDPWLHVEWARALLEGSWDGSRHVEARRHLEAAAGILATSSDKISPPPWSSASSGSAELLQLVLRTQQAHTAKTQYDVVWSSMTPSSRDEAISRLRDLLTDS